MQRKLVLLYVKTSTRASLRAAQSIHTNPTMADTNFTEATAHAARHHY